MTFLKKILLVDYEPTCHRAGAEALESTGKYVIKEENGTAAARECRALVSAGSHPLRYVIISRAAGGRP